ncbi:MAG TPA: metalloregulator ArsR/SmtB family transcription factor, partial [Pilimelia sp.]|nr:metalloregulator ArsR/SmtB family transcription factor [Pilimelia sp.]
MDDVFRALADPNRRRLLDSLNGRNGQTLGELCAGLGIARQSVSKHLAVLETAHLVTTVRRGREKLHYLNTEPVNAIADRWISRYHRGRARALADLKAALEAPPVTETSFVYTTYVRTTPQRLWQALTDPAFTSRYWGVTFDTDWVAGATMTWQENGRRTAHPDQVVLAAEPPRRLSYTWHTFTQEWADGNGFDAAFLDRATRERRSKVTFDIEPHGALVKLTVTHDDFDPGSVVRETVSQGWPMLLSSLKTMLE